MLASSLWRMVVERSGCKMHAETEKFREDGGREKWM